MLAKKCQEIVTVPCSSGDVGEGICADNRVLSRLHDLKNSAVATSSR